MESRVSLACRHLPKGKTHHTNHTIDDGVIAVYEASRCVPTFVGAFDILSTTHSCTTLQKHQRKQHVCHCSNGEFGNHGNPPQSIVSSHRRRTFSCQVGHDRTYSFIVDSFIRSFTFDPLWCLWGFVGSGAHCCRRNYHGRPCSSNSLVTCGDMTSHATHRVFGMTK